MNGYNNSNIIIAGCVYIFYKLNYKELVLDLHTKINM